MIKLKKYGNVCQKNLDGDRAQWYLPITPAIPETEAERSQGVGYPEDL